MSNLSCNFSQAVAGAPTTGTTWSGGWPVGATFTCTGTLNEITGVTSTDLAKVSAKAGAQIAYDA